MTTKRFHLHLWLLMLLAVAVGCKEDFDTPPMVVPTATHTPNTSISELKAKYWQSGRNFCDTIKEDIVVHGWVSGNDESGNLYKVMYIQDETGGIGISIDANSLYTTYREGQEIVLNLKNRWIGKYNGQYLLGYPEWYAAQSTWEAGRMQLEIFKEFCELNGLPNMENVKPLNVKISDFQGKADTETQLKYSGQLVKIQGVRWEGADGTTTFSTPDETTNRTIVDENGNQLTVRNSNYADFHADPLPLGEGDVTGILVMTGSDTWQLFLRKLGDVDFDFGTKGTLADPYTVGEAIELQGSGKNRWMTGYVVGAVAPEVTTISGNSDIEWKAPTTLKTTLVIAASPEVKDISQCVVIALPQGSKFREQANLNDNPEVYQTQIWVKGEFATYMGANGITGNSGSTDEYKLSVATGGITQLSEDFTNGLPSDWLNLQVSGDKKWYTTEFDQNTYAAMTGYRGNNPPFDSWLITPALAINKAENKILNFRTQVNGYGSTTSIFEVYVMSTADPSTATLVKLNPTLATAPASGYSNWAQSGDIDLSQFDGTYYVGFRFYATQDANYATWCLDDVKFNSSGTTPPPTPQPSGTRADFETMNGGEAKSTYGTYSSAAGWNAVNCNLLRGGEADGNPVFTFIGFMDGSTTAYAFAPCLNGKTSAAGTVTSPTLSGGLTQLKFNYGMPYSDTLIKFRVDILQGGQAVKSWTINKTDAVKFQVYTFSETADITGDFQIVFTNLSPSGQDSNKDRVCLWNVNWQNKTTARARRR